jgi:hypothetical protein
MIYKTRNIRKAQILLSGPDGNAFALMGTAMQLARRLGLDGPAITAEMRTGDYEHLIRTFDRYFGHIVDLIRE